MDGEECAWEVCQVGRAMVDLLPDESMIANKFILDFWLKLNDQFCHKSSVQTE